MCVHDETWKDCEASVTVVYVLLILMGSQGGHAPEDFVRQINEEYAKLNGAAART